MQFLVTGGLGYIGTALCADLLHSGHDVTCVDNLRYKQGRVLPWLSASSGFSFIRADVCDIDRYASEISRADVVIPLAALVGEPVCRLYPHEATRTNLDAIHELMRRVSPSQRVIFPMTNSGYGQTDGSSEVTEESPLQPISHYGKTKADAEKIVLQHPRAVSLRLATVFGISLRMRFDLLVNDLTQKLLEATEENPVVIYEPHFWRNFIHIRDVVRAIIFMSQNVLAGIYNLGDSRANCTKLGLAHLICDELGLSRNRVETGEGSDPDGRNYRVSNRKLAEAGFTCRRTLSDGIREVAGLLECLTDSDIAEGRNVLRGEA